MLLVFGSINLDIAMRAPRLPLPGETILGTDCVISPGGKGANQAHAAARYGMTTALYGAVGADAFAAPALASLERAGVDLSGVQRLPGRTGCASIIVDESGQNQIVVAPGVNLDVRQEAIPDDALKRARAVLLQMETDPAENWKLITRARALGCRIILNNAPAQPLPARVLAAVDVLIVNQIELTQTAELSPETLARDFNLTVVLTLGEQGAQCWSGGETLQCPAAKVDVVDTTGAGDTFAGVLTSVLIEGREMSDALSIANAAAGLSCTRVGAQIAQPSRAEIGAAL